jgi:hypothetical protein
MNLEQCTYLPESVEDCLPTSSLDTGQLSLLSGSHMPAKSYGNVQQKDGSQDCTCGKGTLDCSIHPSTPEKWIASMRDSLARTLALLESRQAYLREPDQVFTEKSCVLLASFDQNTCSWRTLQQSFLTDSEPYSETWPRWGMTQDGAAYAHQMWERRITETGGSQWPTPRASVIAAKSSMSVVSRIKNPRGNLEEVVYARTFPTPTARDYKDGVAEYFRDGILQTDTLGRLLGGTVNPPFVAWLMGFPIWWANSKDTVTRKSLSKQQQHGNCSEASE